MAKRMPSSRTLILEPTGVVSGSPNLDVLVEVNLCPCLIESGELGMTIGSATVSVRSRVESFALRVSGEIPCDLKHFNVEHVLPGDPNASTVEASFELAAEETKALFLLDVLPNAPIAVDGSTGLVLKENAVSASLSDEQWKRLFAEDGPVCPLVDEVKELVVAVSTSLVSTIKSGGRKFVL